MTEVLPGTERPGGSVEEEYRSALKSWRRRARRFHWPVTGAGVAILLAGLAVPGRNWGLVLTATGAYLLGAVAQLRNSPPTTIQNLALGAEGERETARELGRLAAGWTVRHDLNGRFGNLDHVLLGPAGVFILETKAWWAWTVGLSSAGPELRSRHSRWAARSERGLSRTMKIRAARMNEALADLTRISPWVTPVVVVWADFPQRAVEHDGVWFVHGGQLRRWLEDRPNRLSEVQIGKLSRVLGAESRVP